MLFGQAPQATGFNYSNEIIAAYSLSAGVWLANPDQHISRIFHK